jgi:hypothetical protein
MVQAMHSGSCLCGKVAFQVALENNQVHVCHCQICQKWSGGPGLSIKCSGEWHIQGEDNVRWYDSSEWAQRAFCGECGSHLFFRLKDGNYHAVVPQVLNDTEGFEIDMHIFIDRKPPYYDFTDHSKRLTSEEFYQMVGATE